MYLVIKAISFCSAMPAGRPPLPFLRVCLLSLVSFGDIGILTIDGAEQRKVILLAMLVQEAIDSLRSRNTLQLLPIHLGLFNLLDADALLNRMRRRSYIPASIAARNQIRNPSALLCKGLFINRPGEPRPPKANHLADSLSNHRRLGVLAPLLAHHESRRQGNDILQRPSQRNTRNIINYMDKEIRPAKQRLPKLRVNMRVILRDAVKLDTRRLQLRLPLLIHFNQVILRRPIVFSEIHRRRVVSDCSLA